jgi:hypothetical protein
VLRLSGASVLEGGIPLIVDGKLIGAVGVSGVTSEQDAQIAQAGAEALTSKGPLRAGEAIAGPRLRSQQVERERRGQQP